MTTDRYKKGGLHIGDEEWNRIGSGRGLKCDSKKQDV